MVKNVIQRPQQFQIYKNHLFKEASQIYNCSVLFYHTEVNKGITEGGMPF